MIACVLRSGGIYRPEHVQRLAAQAAQWAPGEPFVCLSDMHVDGVETIALHRGWPGWWSKLELFRPGVVPDGTRVLYADLDTTFLGPVDGLLARPEPFLALADFYRRPPVVPKRGLGSGLLQWTAGTHDDLYATFAADPDGWQRRCGFAGDQKFLELALGGARVTFWEDVAPGVVVSYKVHCRQGVPAGARVVCFHGRPKPWDVPDLVPASEEAACR